MTTVADYPNLEPHHEVTVEPENDGLVLVTCPFTDEEGTAFQTTWSKSADPAEINCLFCEYLDEEHLESPEHGPDDAETAAPKKKGKS